ITVIRTLIRVRRADESVELFKPLFRALDIYAPLLRRFLMQVAEASHPRRISLSAMPRAERVVQRPLPFGTPHQPVYLVGRAIIFGQPNQEVAVIGLQRAKRARPPALPIQLAQVLDARNVISESIFVPAIHLHAAPMRLGQ